ncbi:L,D-transpeptidase [Limosilactobacillus sp.]|uniref:L,D-transpeptidase n=1 Tax=Limosilactobacillus sp. TaxID=2773925 RepID=UPI003EFFABCC
MIDQQNRANLDHATVNNNHLVLSGWHATNMALNKPHHFIIIYDQTSGREVTRQEVTNLARPDVAKVFPTIAGAGQSGFDVQLPLTNINFNHELQVVSRYSASTDGNSDYIDYWFAPLTNGRVENWENLDNFDISDGQHLVVTGWHVTTVMPFENQQTILLYDMESNELLAAAPATIVHRPDVAKVYPNVPGAENSGFTASFDLAKLKLVPGHNYIVTSRSSTNSDNNGINPEGNYNDGSFKVTLPTNQQAYSIDSMQMTKDGLKVTGWMASQQSMHRPYAYVIVLNNGKEVGRTAVKLASRPDVAKVYSGIYDSANSGFSTLVALNPTAVNGTMQVILRFTDDPAGNGNFVDQYVPATSSNAGNFDKVQVNGNGLYVSGWHASNQAVNKPYEYLIFLNQNGQELYRQRVLDINRSRADVAKVYPGIYNSDRSGYQLGFNMPANLQHQQVYIIHRFTDDPAGNGNFSDYRSGLVSLGLMRLPIDYRQPSEYAPYPNVRQLGNFWIHVRIGQNRVYLMDGNNVVYTMYCTAGYYQNGVSTTPTGTFYVQAERGNSFYNGSLGEGANYWTSFLQHGVYLFHTVPTDARGNYKPYEASQLGVNQGSHGCIRLSVPDAYWFMHNVPTGTRVVIDN